MKQDREIISVGIDIGTTTTSMIVSRLGMANTAASHMVPDISITTKDIIYRSELYLTPLLDREMLDAEKIRGIIENEYVRAGIRPADVETGAVIITGESALKENARSVLEALSSFAGDFVVSTAGPDLESIISGRGAGAERFSKTYGCLVANLDIGGGTTNISVFNCGEVEGQTCIDIGGRLMTYDDSGRVTYVSRRLSELLGEAGRSAVPGDRVSDTFLRETGELMADAILDAVSVSHTRLTEIMTTASSRPLRLQDPVQYMSFSGGVSDCYYNFEMDLRRYNDLGPAIAQALKERVERLRLKVIRPAETIRATVVGAGTYMTEVSGSTISYNDDIFPIKNLPVYVIPPADEKRMYEGSADEVIRDLAWYQSQSREVRFAVSVRGKQQVTYNELCHLAEAFIELDESAMPEDEPLIIICENDLAKALGQVMGRKARRRKSVLCLDRIRVRSGDFIDIGRPVMNGVAVPVVVKTLIFD